MRLTQRRQRLYCTTILVSALTALVVDVNPAAAQAASGTSTDGATPSPAQQPASNAAELGEIIVTAEKRSVSVQNVAATDIAVPAVVIARADLLAAADLVKIAPGVEIPQSFGYALIFLRGLGQPNPQINFDPYVATNLNDAPLSPHMSNTALFDLDRVEILFGPQGTIYGQNALAGVVNFQSKRPTFSYEGSVSVEAGNYDTVNTTAVFNAPVTEDVAVRVAYNRQQHNGYLNSGQDDSDTDTIRLSALYDPKSDTSVYAVVTVGREGGNGVGLTQNPPDSSPFGCGNFCTPVDPSLSRLYWHQNSYVGTLEIKHDVSSQMTLTSITNYDHLNYDGTSGVTAFPALGSLVQYEALWLNNKSEEIRANWNIGSLSGLVGLYAYRNDATEQQLENFEFIVPPTSAGPFTDTESGESLYANVTYAFTPQLRLTGGARYSFDQRRLLGENYDVIGGVALPAVSGDPLGYANSLNHSRPDFKGGVEYDVLPKSMAYATIATGYTGAGFNTAPTSATNNRAPPFADTTGISYIGGIKNRLYADRVQINVEAYYNRYTNYQLVIEDLATGQDIVSNAPRTSTYGVQLDSRFKMTEADELGVGVNLMRAKINEFALTMPPFTNYAGNQLPNAPNVSVNADYRHVFPLPGDSTFEFYALDRYSSSQWAIFSHPPGTLISAYNTVDSSMTYRPSSGRWSVGAWGKNLSNNYRLGLIAAVGGVGVGVPNPPRTYGLRFTASF